MTLPILDPILNGNPANAELVQANFEKVATYVDGSLINADGTVAMTAPLTLSATTPTANLHAVRLLDLNAIIPAGVMFEYSGATAPAGRWLLCTGQILNTADADYAALAAVIGQGTGGIYWDGVSSVGASQFQLPDWRNRTAIGAGGSLGSRGVRGGTADSIVVTHTHTGPSHNHSGPNHRHTGSSLSATDSSSGTISGGSHGHTDTFATSLIGSSHGHLISGSAPSGASFLYRLASSSGSQFEVQSGAGMHVAWTSTTGLENASHSHGLTGSVTTSTSHSHSQGNHGHAISGSTGYDGTGVTGLGGTGVTGSSGSSGTNQNYQPYILVTKIIRY